MASNAAVQRQQLRQQNLKRNRQQRAQLQSVPAPVLGWNTIDSVADLQPTEASAILNCYPEMGDVRVRQGYVKGFNGTGTGDVLTLAEYISGSNRQLISASASNIYNLNGSQGTYAVTATAFTGSQYLLRGGSLTGITDAKVGSTSFWINPVIATDQVIFNIQDALGGAFGIRILHLSGGSFQIVGNNSSGTIILELDSVGSFTNTNIWYNVLASWDLSAGTTNLYVSNVSSSTSPTHTNDTIDYTKTDCSFGANTAGNNLLHANISEFWFTNTYIDFSSGANRAKFIDSNGYPVSLGVDGSTPTGTKPIVYLNQQASSFQTNEGSGGNFSVTGSLSASSTSPTSKGLSIGSGFSSGRWQTVNFGSKLFLANGVDTPQTWDGTTLANATLTGPTVTNLIGCCVYSSRLWVWEKNNQNVWYSAVNTIGGAYTQFPLANLMTLGGNLVAAVTWTHDGGSGADDFIVFVMSSGQVVVYSGDPATTFSQVGTYTIPAPLGIRGVIPFGGDVLIMTKQDYVILSQVLSGVRTPSKVSGDVITVAAAYGSNLGWQAQYWPKGGRIMFNIPTSSATFDQHVLNVVTGAWTKYTNIPSRCWGLYNDNLYFGGGNGVVYQAETGTDDDGSVINYDITQAYNYLGAPINKRVTAFRPVISSEGTLNLGSGISFDFSTTNVTQNSTSALPGPAWDQTLWDTALWSPLDTIHQDWKMSDGRGYQCAIRLTGSAMDQNILWYRTDYLYETGGPI